MSKTFRPWDVEQGWLLPPSVHDLVPAGHLAHFVRDTVRESLDLGAILSCYGEERGYPPYHPAMMVALLLYGYSRGVYSSRRVERACEERVDFMAVTAMNRPDFRTIAEFRRRHLQALGALFVQVLQLCRAAGLAKLGHVALDGTKVAANASKHKAMSYGRMREAEAKLAAEVAAWFARAEAVDAEEDRVHGAERRGDELPGWVKDKQARLARIRAAKAVLEAEAKAPPPAADGDGPGPSSGMMKSGRPCRASDGGPPDRAQRNFTDPDSRIQPTQGGGVLQGYNAQIAVDGAHQIILAQRLSPPTPPTRPPWCRWSRRSGTAAGATPRNSRPTPASAPRPISPPSSAAASKPTSPPGAPATATGRGAKGAASRRARAWPPWRPSSNAPGGAAAIACASRSSSRCSARSRRPEDSASSCSAASTRSAASGR